MSSPYAGVKPADWLRVTEQLVAAHPLSGDQIVAAVVDAWSSIFENSRIGNLRIGTDFFPQAQSLGIFLHELIPLEIAKHAPGWRRGAGKNEKDAVYESDRHFDFEIKTSSSTAKIFANRSYAQPAEGGKERAGYYLAVNFQSWDKAGDETPQLKLIRFGYLEHSDWIAQTSQRGQQARLTPEADLGKFVVLVRR